MASIRHEKNTGGAIYSSSSKILPVPPLRQISRTHYRAKARRPYTVKLNDSEWSVTGEWLRLSGTLHGIVHVEGYCADLRGIHH